MLKNLPSIQKIHEKLVKSVKGKKAIIWDFDGVFCFADWNYGGDLAQWWDKLWQLLEEFDPQIREKFSGGLKYYYEHTDYTAKRHGKKALEKINQFYLEKELSILPGSPMNEQLIFLMNDFDKNIEHYIWSNNQGEFISKALRKTGILGKFRAIVSRDKVDLAKPNLHGFKIIQSVTSIPIKDFLFVGDSKNTDAVASEKLGMDFFLYRI